MKTVKFGRSCGRRGTGRVCAWIFSHTRGRRASSVLCVPSTRGERSSAVPHPPGSPRYPRDSLGTASPLPAGLHRLPGRGEAAGAADRPSLHPRGLPQHSAAGAESPSAGAWGWGSRGGSSSIPPWHTAAPFPPLPLRSVASLLSQPILLCRPGVFTSSPGRGRNVSPHRVPKCRDPAAPRHPRPARDSLPQRRE